MIQSAREEGDDFDDYSGEKSEVESIVKDKAYACTRGKRLWCCPSVLVLHLLAPYLL